MKKYIPLFVLIFLIALTSYFIFKPKHIVRYAVFAGYNANNKIKPYVIHYLKGLNEVTDGVVYITDSTLDEEEKKKVSPYIMHGEFIRHEEYDFGSYKRGFNWLKENGYLKKADEIIFANDSTFAPLTSFKPMFKAIEQRKDLAFWGDLQNTKFNPHIQSYFIVFRKPVIRTKTFANFLNNIHHQEHSSLYITEYEIKLTPLLNSLGLKGDSYMPYSQLSYLEYSDKNAYPLTLIKDYQHQFLKRRTFTTALPIYEDKTQLMEYIKQNYQTIYQFIIEEFPEYTIK